MEWVTTTGKTVDDAKEAALDELGVDESEAEFEVLEEPRSSFFKLSRSEAKVRARVSPKAPRPKQERRSRRGRSRRDEAPAAAPAARTAERTAAPAAAAGSRSGSGSAVAASAAATATVEAEPAATEAGTGAPDGDAGTSAAQTSGGSGRNRRRRNRSRNRSGSASGGESATQQEGKAMTDDVVNVDQQADIIGEFLDGLLDAISVTGEITRTKVDDDTVELGVTGGDDLGLLIGPKGQTLTAVHELSRTVLQRQATGRHDGRVRIDIGGYRQRRAEALARFVTAQAEAVREAGVARALEPMNAVDRKVVHDTVNGIEGVATISEGADPHRRVVIVPETAAE